MKIGILNVATNVYKNFLPKLHESINKYFLTDYDKEYFVWSDGDCSSDLNINLTKIESKGWPEDSLLRYHYFLMKKKELLDCDYLFYLDADMLVVDEVGDEVLTDLLGVQHPGFHVNKQGTPETRPESTAFVEPSKIKQYCCGGFNGGSSSCVVEMSETLSKNIDIDSKNGIVAVWYDESHLNKYFTEVSPTKILNCGYCAPESAWSVPYQRKILALDKSVDELKGSHVNGMGV